MSRFLPLCLLLLALSAPLSAQTLSRLQRVPPNATLIIQTSYPAGAPIAGPIFDRCRLVSVDSSTLTCLDSRRTPLIFPIRQLDAVYEIHKSHAGLIAAWIGVAALTALMIAGAVTGNLGFYIVAFIVSGTALTASFTSGTPPFSRPYPPPYSSPVPWNHGETSRLVYACPIPWTNSPIPAPPAPDAPQSPR